jgi:hypothetical protein
MKKTKNESYFNNVTRLICRQNGLIRLLNKPIEICHVFNETYDCTPNGRNHFQMCHLIGLESLDNEEFKIFFTLTNSKNKFTCSRTIRYFWPTHWPRLLWSRIHALETDIRIQLSLFPDDLPVSTPIKRKKRVKK